MPKSRHDDTAWRRLPFLLPPAFLLSSLILAGFLALLAGSPIPPPRPTEIAMQLVELPPPAPPPAPASEPEQPVEPEPTIEPPAQPVAPAPQAAKPKPSPRPSPPRPAAIPPAPSPVAPIPPAVASPASPSSLPGGGTMAARVLFQPRPEIPDALRGRALDLVAIARFRISASGVAEVELITPTPDPILNRAILEALQRWRFFPSMEDGKPIASVLEIRIPLSVR